MTYISLFKLCLCNYSGPEGARVKVPPLFFVIIITIIIIIIIVFIIIIIIIIIIICVFCAPNFLCGYKAQTRIEPGY